MSSSLNDNPDYFAFLALEIPCSFCNARKGTPCDIEGFRRKGLGEPYPSWLPFWERGVHRTRAAKAFEEFGEEPQLIVAVRMACRNVL